MRIASLPPSATETVCALGLTDHLVGVTRECDFPPGVHPLPAGLTAPVRATSGRGAVERDAAIATA
jgi:iron complex transport system substrate-binding protein